MVYIVYNPDRTIKTYMDQIEDYPLAEGETYSVSKKSMLQYSKLFVISYKGQPCVAVHAKVGDPPLIIDVACPKVASVDVLINGTRQTVALTNGTGTVQIPTTAPQVYEILPADRQTYCAAGAGSLLIAVE